MELYLSFLVALLSRNAAHKHTTDLKKNIMEYYKFYWTPENIYIENSEDLRVQSSRSFASKSTDLFSFYFREGWSALTFVLEVLYRQPDLPEVNYLTTTNSHHQIKF